MHFDTLDVEAGDPPGSMTSMGESETSGNFSSAPMQPTGSETGGPTKYEWDLLTRTISHLIVQQASLNYSGQKQIRALKELEAFMNKSRQWASSAGREHETSYSK